MRGEGYPTGANDAGDPTAVQERERTQQRQEKKNAPKESAAGKYVRREMEKRRRKAEEEKRKREEEEEENERKEETEDRTAEEQKEMERASCERLRKEKKKLLPTAKAKAEKERLATVRERVLRSAARPPVQREQKMQTTDETAQTQTREEEEESGSERVPSLRAPICCILGNVDAGKTQMLDNVRGTHVQDAEAGGITQQMGATFVPARAIRERTASVHSGSNRFRIALPGLLVLDTPGHASFANLRARGPTSTQSPATYCAWPPFGETPTRAWSCFGAERTTCWRDAPWPMERGWRTRRRWRCVSATHGLATP